MLSKKQWFYGQYASQIVSYTISRSEMKDSWCWGNKNVDVLLRACPVSVWKMCTLRGSIPSQNSFNVTHKRWILPIKEIGYFFLKNVGKYWKLVKYCLCGNKTLRAGHYGLAVIEKNKLYGSRNIGAEPWISDTSTKRRDHYLSALTEVLQFLSIILQRYSVVTLHKERNVKRNNGILKQFSNPFPKNYWNVSPKKVGMKNALHDKYICSSSILLFARWKTTLCQFLDSQL